VTLLALDLGKKRVGVAISHGILAEAFLTLDFDEENKPNFFSRLEKIIEEQKVDKVILGIPLGRDMQKTDQTHWTEGMMQEIRKELSIPVESVDEAYSTVAAEEKVNKVDGKVGIDAKAAKVILEQFLNEER